MQTIKRIGGGVKRALLRVLTRRQAEQALFLKTVLLYYLATIPRLLAGRTSPTGRADIHLRRYTDDAGQIAFGYYDVTPFSADNQLLLATRFPLHSRPPLPSEKVDVGYFDWRREAAFRPLGTTTTWCWQQGCRLQWLSADKPELVIYNRLVNGSYGAVVQNIRTGYLEREYESPVYSMDPSGRFAVFLNFSRLNRLRPGYGYVDLPDTSMGDCQPEKDGVFLLDLESGRTDLLVSLKALAELRPSPSMKGASHYVNHLCFSPSGRKFLFFHLWDSAERSHARLMTCDRSSGHFEVIEDAGEVSHYAWQDDDNLLATFLYENKTARYQLYTAGQPGYSTVLGDTLTRDGHPSYSRAGSLILTDTYADQYGDQQLMLVSQDHGVMELGRYHSPLMIRLRHRGEARCDLHPRWDRTGEHICFDSTHGGARALYVMDLPAELFQEWPGKRSN